MTCTGAPSVKRMFIDANRIAPNRKKASDGICASSQHHAQNPSSDHEAGPDGLAHAGDLTHDPANGWDAHARAKEAIARRDRRLKYTISNRTITSSYPVGSKPAWTPRPYNGSNPHIAHAHQSVKSGPSYDNDTSPWWGPAEEGELAGEAQKILDALDAFRDEVDNKLATIAGHAATTASSVGPKYAGGPTLQKALVKKEDGEFQEHLNIVQMILEEVVNRLGEIEDAVKKLSEDPPPSE